MKNLSTIKKESIVNEGAMAHLPTKVINHLIKTISDFIKGMEGKNGSNDPSHPNKAKVNKEIRAALKLIKSAKRNITDKDIDIWLRDTVIKESYGDNINMLLEGYTNATMIALDELISNIDGKCKKAMKGNNSKPLNDLNKAIKKVKEARDKIGDRDLDAWFKDMMSQVDEKSDMSKIESLEDPLINTIDKYFKVFKSIKDSELVDKVDELIEDLLSVKDSLDSVLSGVTESSKDSMKSKQNEALKDSKITENAINEKLDRKSNKIYTELKSYLKDEELGSPQHQYAVMILLKAILVDINDHDNAKRVSSLFPKAKSNMKKEFVEYIENSVAPEYASIAKWDGYHIFLAFDKYIKETIPNVNIMSLLEGVEFKKMRLSESRKVRESINANKGGKYYYNIHSINTDTGEKLLLGKVKALGDVIIMHNALMKNRGKDTPITYSYIKVKGTLK